jgi:uncharacterized protein involved in exopolysaccharide biosynthesis
MRRLDHKEASRESGSAALEYWRILWRKKYFVLIPVVVASLITVVGVRFLKPVYKSSALIRMEDQTYLTEEVAQFLSMQERRQAYDEETLARIRAEIQSTGFIDQVIGHLGLAENPRSIAQAQLLQQTQYPDISVDELLQRRLKDILTSKIKVELVGPGIFEIACHDYSPQTCYLLANAITTLFIDSQRDKQMRGLSEAGEFSDEQVEIYKTRLEASELELQSVQDRITRLALQGNPVGEASKEYQEEFGGESNLRYAEALQEQLAIRAAELENIIDRTRRRLIETLGALPTSAALSQDSELVKLKSSLIAHRQTTTRLDLGARGVTTKDLEDNAATIKANEDAIERLLTQLVDREFSAVDRDYRPLVVEYYLQGAILASQRAKLDRLESYIVSYKGTVDLAPRLDAERAQLAEQVKTDRELYNSFLRAKTSTQIGQAIQNTNLGVTVDVLEPAARPLAPVRPKKRQIVLLGIILGACLGIGGLLASEYTDTSFDSIEQIESRLGLRVLGTVPIINEVTAWNKTKYRKQITIWAVTSVAVIVVSLVGFYLYGRMADRIAISGSQSSAGEGKIEVHAE